MTGKKAKYSLEIGSTPDGTFAKRRLYFTALLLLLLVLLTYSGAIRNNFVDWDDHEYVIDNPLVRSGGQTDWKGIFSTVVSSNYHPLTILSLHLNDNICADCPNGISPKPFIAGNILLHTLNTLLVFVLIYLLFSRNLVLAFMVAALFAVHPMHVESVAWISARKDVLSSFFFLSGLILWYRYLVARERRYLWLSLAFLLYVLACLSKATAVVFPLVAILVRYLTAGNEEEYAYRSALSQTFSRKILLALFPFFAVSLVFGWRSGSRAEKISLGC